MTGSPRNKQYWHISPRKAMILSFATGLFLTMAIIAIEISTFMGEIPFEKYLSIDGILFSIIVMTFSLIELYLLAEIGIRATATIIATGISEFENMDEPLLSSLARASMDIDEPHQQPLGLNPAQFVKKRRQLLLTVIWRIKSSATNFIAKQIFKRLLSRSALRAFSAFFAAPVIGFWNAWGMYLALAEVRHRIVGRRICEQIMAYLDSRLPSGSPAWEFITRIVALRIIHFGTYNVNLEYLISELRSRSEEGKFIFPDSLEVSIYSSDFLDLLSKDEAIILKKCALFVFALKRQASTLDEKYVLRSLDISVEEVEKIKHGFSLSIWAAATNKAAAAFA